MKPFSSADKYKRGLAVDPNWVTPSIALLKLSLLLLLPIKDKQAPVLGSSTITAKFSLELISFVWFIISLIFFWIERFIVVLIVLPMSFELIFLFWASLFKTSIE